MNKLYKPTKLIINNIIKTNNSLRVITVNSININMNNKIYNNYNNNIRYNSNNNNLYSRTFTTTTTTSTTTSINNNNNSNNSTPNIQNENIVKSEQDNDNSKYNITLTDSCVRELNKIQNQKDDSYLRVMVDMGGCSGYQYIIKVEDSIQDDDVLFTRDGAKVIIDKISLDMMVGAVIDYETNLMRSSFCVASNPNTIKSCGCKISFDLKK